MKKQHNFTSKFNNYLDELFAKGRRLWYGSITDQPDIRCTYDEHCRLLKLFIEENDNLNDGQTILERMEIFWNSDELRAIFDARDAEEAENYNQSLYQGFDEENADYWDMMDEAA